jgi:hypothetical protein
LMFTIQSHGPAKITLALSVLRALCRELAPGMGHSLVWATCVWHTLYKNSYYWCPDKL